MLNVFDFATPEARHEDKPLTPEQAAAVEAGTLTPVNEYAWYTIEANTAYPATLAHIVDIFARPPEPLGQLWAKAQRLGKEVMLAAVEGEPGDPTRAEALEIARLWFTEVLHQAVGRPLGIHWAITDERWKQ